MKSVTRFLIFAFLALCLAGQSVAYVNGGTRTMTTPATKRQQIVSKVIARLARISIANGFATDIGATPADDWPTRYTETDLREATRLGVFDLTAKSFQDYPEEKKIMNTLPLQVRIFHQRPSTPAQLRLMIGDVMRAVIEDEVTGARDATFGGLAVDTKPDEDGFIVPKETFAIEGAAVGFTVDFLAPPFDAYDMEVT
jgi:hypothetical protein